MSRWLEKFIPPGQQMAIATPISLGLSWLRKPIATFWEWLAIFFHYGVNVALL